MSPETTAHAANDVDHTAGDLYAEAVQFNGQVDEAHQLLQETGVGELAREMLTAHGRTVSMATAIAGCKPFGESIRGTVDALHEAGVTDPDAIGRGVRKSLERQIQKAPETVGDAEKK